MPISTSVQGLKSSSLAHSSAAAAAAAAAPHRMHGMALSPCMCSCRICLSCYHKFIQPLRNIQDLAMLAADRAAASCCATWALPAG